VKAQKMHNSKEQTGFYIRSSSVSGQTHKGEGVMKTPQKTLLIFAIATTLCALLVAVVSAEPAAPNGPIVISKTVSPRVITPDYTGVLTYTVTITNTATPSVLNAYMQDELPTLLSFGQWVTKPTIGTITTTGDAILWTGTLAAPPTSGPGTPHVLTFVFTANLPGPESMSLVLAKNEIVNTAYAGRMEGTNFIPEASDTAITRIRRFIFLPLVVRSSSQ
jgi:uncharacterized repeat protein (TIGR01451 family)